MSGPTATARGATYADARLVRRLEESISVKTGRVEGVASGESEGIGIRVLYSSEFVAAVAPLRWLLPGIFTLSIGKVLVAEPYGPVNWATKIDLTTGRPVEDPSKRTNAKGNTTGICPAAIGFKDQQPSSYDPESGLFFVPTNNICMDYEGVEVKYSAGQPYVGAIVRMFPGPGGNRGAVIAWDPMKGKIVWKDKENLAAYGGTMNTAGTRCRVNGK